MAVNTPTSPTRRVEDRFTVARLKNQTDTAEGSSLPPRLAGPFRVPFVSNLQIVKTNDYFGGTEFTLTWTGPDQSLGLVDHFNIYVRGVFHHGPQVLGPQTVSSPPASVRIVGPHVVNVVFYVQTVLKNGILGDLFSSPSVAGITIGPNVVGADIVPATITVTELAPLDTMILGTVNQIDAILNGSNQLVLSLANFGVQTIAVADSPFSAGTKSTYLCNATGGNITVNLPAAASSSGRSYNFKKTDSSTNTVTLDGNGGETIDGATTLVITTQYDSFSITCDGSNWFII